MTGARINTTVPMPNEIAEIAMPVKMTRGAREMAASRPTSN